MSDTLKIKCNWQARETIYWWDLTDKERKEFDYLDDEEKQSDASFVRYKGWTYDLHEFIRIDRSIAPHCQRPQWEKFNGYHSDSFFSGVLIKFDDDDSEYVICATYYS
jgi:hypothetical protein